jgi:DNA helicase-2/ATP-dependent DNA helicase PcrA
MYRTNAQSRTLEDALVRKRIPYQLVGGTRFYDRREIRDVLAYLRLVHNPLDEIALQRVINVPTRGIGDKAWGTLSAAAMACGVPLWPALQLIAADELAGVSPAAAAIPIDGRTRNALGGFHDLLARLITAREQLDVTALLGLILESTNYAKHLRDGTDEGEERWENVVELRNVAVDFEAMPPREGLAALLESVALVADVDALDAKASADRVTLLTLHAAKGLEYPTVIITGLEEGHIPHSRSADDPDGLAEERRLFYVGLTRAERTLILVRAHRRTVYGQTDIREPSRFLLDLPLEAMAEMPPATGVRGSPVHARATAWPSDRRGGAPAGGSMGSSGAGRRPGPAPSPGSAGGEATFRPGDKVRHGTFGEGVVVTASARDGDEEVTVAFVGAGVKKLMQSFARLERVR